MATQLSVVNDTLNQIFTYANSGLIPTLPLSEFYVKYSSKIPNGQYRQELIDDPPGTRRYRIVTYNNGYRLGVCLQYAIIKTFGLSDRNVHTGTLYYDTIGNRLSEEVIDTNGNILNRYNITYSSYNIIDGCEAGLSRINGPFIYTVTDECDRAHNSISDKLNYHTGRVNISSLFTPSIRRTIKQHGNNQISRIEGTCFDGKLSGLFTQIINVNLEEDKTSVTNRVILSYFDDKCRGWPFDNLRENKSVDGHKVSSHKIIVKANIRPEASVWLIVKHIKDTDNIKLSVDLPYYSNQYYGEYLMFVDPPQGTDRGFIISNNYNNNGNLHGICRSMIYTDNTYCNGIDGCYNLIYKELSDDNCDNIYHLSLRDRCRQERHFVSTKTSEDQIINKKVTTNMYLERYYVNGIEIRRGKYLEYSLYIINKKDQILLKGLPMFVADIIYTTERCSGAVGAVIAYYYLYWLN